jgi:hypothetical protein
VNGYKTVENRTSGLGGTRKKFGPFPHDQWIVVVASSTLPTHKEVNAFRERVAKTIVARSMAMDYFVDGEYVDEDVREADEAEINAIPDREGLRRFLDRIVGIVRVTGQYQREEPWVQSPDDGDRRALGALESLPKPLQDHLKKEERVSALWYNGTTVTWTLAQPYEFKEPIFYGRGAQVAGVLLTNPKSKGDGVGREEFIVAISYAIYDLFGEDGRAEDGDEEADE